MLRGGGGSYIVAFSLTTPEAMQRLTYLLSLFALLLIGCEGPEGPVGPAGPTGPRGETGLQGPAGSFSFHEVRTGRTDTDGIGEESFEGRTTENTLFACWIRVGEGWVQIAFDSVLTADDHVPVNLCAMTQTGTSVTVEIVAASGATYLMTAYGV